MAMLMRLVRSVPKLADAWNPRLFAAGTPRTVQAPTGSGGEDAEGMMKGEGMSEGGNSMMGNNRSMMGKMMEDQQQDSFSTGDAQHMMKEMAGGQHAQALGNAVNDMGDKAREAMRDAWDSAKNTAQSAADSARSTAQSAADSARSTAQSAADSAKNTAQSAAESAGDMADHTAHSVKQNAESVKRSMNTKQN